MIKYLPVLFALACTPTMNSMLDKLADASALLCDSLALHEKYSDDVESIKELIEEKQYMSALFVTKALYTEAQANGDAAAVEQLVPLMTTLQSLASKIPLSVQKPDSGNKIL